MKEEFITKEDYDEEMDEILEESLSLEEKLQKIQERSSEVKIIN